jgi:hypothetical protein
MHHIEELQHQFNKLPKTYESLNGTYQHNMDELSNMKAYVDELNLEITILQMKPDLQHCYFDTADINGPWKTPKRESPPSYFDRDPTKSARSTSTRHLTFR